MDYDKELKTLISKPNYTPTLLLHSCCGPCSSYVLEFLSDFFKITILYYNPCIYPETEYNKRLNTQKILIDKLSPRLKNEITIAECNYDSEKFYTAIRGNENEREGGARCVACFNLRLEQTAIYAKEHGFDYFTTTLSVSPHKNADKLNTICTELSEKYQIKSLPANFKKNNGYKRSIELSNEFELYRQSYCGCEYSIEK